jgi:hypothetical protein
MAPDEITLGELSRRFDEFVRRFDADRIDTRNAIAGVNRHIERQFAALQYVPRGEYEAHSASQDRRIESLEQGRTMLVRAFVTSFVFTIVVALVLAVLLGGPR